MTEARPEAVVLSPHLNDAVMSCAGWIYDQAKRGSRPLIVTIFSHTSAHGGSASAREEQRQDEDERAAQLLGASRRLAGFADAESRNPLYRTFAGAICERAPEEDALVSKLSAYLTALLGELSPRRLLVPLGVGRHIDHRLVHEAVASMATSLSEIEVAYYEERPHAFIDEAVRLRLSQVGRHAHAVDFIDLPASVRSERFFYSLLAAPHARCALHPADQARLVVNVLELYARGLQEPSRPARWSASVWSHDILRALLPAFESFASARQGFVGSALYHQWVALEYARRLGYQDQYAERYWYL